MENRHIALITIRNLLEDPELFADKVDAISALAEIDNMDMASREKCKQIFR